ncbi:autotransporter domain-containing protein [Brevundimonas sp. 2R-24]|uniref:Autotransporter domain-containing protein n=1 Tax=Peiella sedimenti TaxID=3061083 RepID=A0ABT8SN31_9CAUL|nr:autotransporter domain-containing protein [Caulobacteraceae bacterium XZ-24]
MRKLLAAAVALAPLAIASGAAAEVVISNARTTPITTGNATGSGADSVRIANGGSITLTSGTAVTVNSNNNFTIDSGGTITFENSGDGSTAVLVNGGVTADITLGGSIRLTDTQGSNTDTDNDGDLDGAFATGTGRFGLRVTGPDPLTGDISLARNSSIILEGNSSAGVSVETGLVGDFSSRATISVLGNDNFGIHLLGPVSGNVTIGGAVAATGPGSTSVSIEGDIGGSAVVDGVLTTTGFRYSTRPSQTFIERLDGDDLGLGGPALRIAGDIAGGLLLDRAQPNLDPDEDDEDNDGITDSSETTAVITSYGPAAAVLIGSDSRAITLGEVGTGDRAYAFINRGSIAGHGVFDGFTGIGVQIGDGQAVTLMGGLRNEGEIVGDGFRASTTAILINSGATVPAIVNTGTILSESYFDGAAFSATGIHIAAGAGVTSFANTGVLDANRLGEDGDARAFVDEAGTVTSITNSGKIRATIFPTDDSDDDDDADIDPGNEEITGQAIALDLRANTTGVSIVQTGVNDGDDGDDDVADPDGDSDGVDDADEPVIQGDILFGSGDDTLDVQNGFVTGAMAFGDGQDQLLISGGSVVRGAVTDTDGLLDINLTSGTLEARQATTTTISSLNVGSGGSLLVSIDAANNIVGGFNVTGAANFATGAAVGVRFTSLLQDPTRFVIVQAGTLTAGALDDDLISTNSPYLFVTQAGTDVGAGQVYVDVRRRTAAEAGLNGAETSALDAVYNALGSDSALRNYFLDQTTRENFINAFEQMLPDHSGGPLMSLAAGVDSVTRALAGRGYPAQPGQTSAWLQEINFYADKDKDQAYGFRSEGFGFAGGIERGTAMGAVGVSVAFTSSDLEDPEAEAEEQLSASLLELGLYWRAQGQRWTTWARVAGGYASFDSTRQFVVTGINRRTESSWNGYTLAAAGGASYEHTFGRYSIRPELMVEYFMLSEDSHEESGGGAGFDLGIDSRDGHVLSSTAAVSFGAAFGQNRWFRPEVRLGWKQNISVEAGETTARFLSGGAPFLLTPDTFEGGGPLIGFRLNVGNEMSFLSLEGDAEMIDDYIRYNVLLRATFRF